MRQGGIMYKVDKKTGVLLPWYFLLGMLGCFIFYVSFLIYAMLFFSNLPLQYANKWLKDVYFIKDFINSRFTNKQRLLIVSGSNSLFGFNGELIDSQTPFTPINYGTHAGLPLNFHVDKIIEQSKDGDIIFMPLEFNYYTNTEPTQDYWYIHNMLVWNKNYTKYLSPVNIVLAYFHNDVSFLGQYVKDNWRAIFSKQPTLQEEATHIQQIWQKMIQNQQKQKYGGYDYKSLNKYGDFCGHTGTHYSKNFDYLAVNLKLSPFFLSEYNRLVEFAKSKNIKVFLTYPVTLENLDFSLNDSKTFEKIQNLKAQLKTHNIEIYGDFRDFHFVRKYFFDTSYHLNTKGAALRTQAFIKLLKQMQKDGLLGTH